MGLSQKYSHVAQTSQVPEKRIVDTTIRKGSNCLRPARWLPESVSGDLPLVAAPEF